MLSLETLRAAPKVLLHDHLDGGLRPATVVELARDQKYNGLPTNDPGELARWFHASAASGSLSLYLRGFAHTIAVMQTVDAIERVAYECGEDLAHDGVVYAEVRYAPIFSTHDGVAHVTLNSWPGGSFVRVVDEPAGWSTAYAHLDTVLVIEGQAIRAGATIGVFGHCLRPAQ